MIITSNHPLDRIQQLSEGRIHSRLRHMCEIVKMPDEDLRDYFRYSVRDVRV